MAKIETLERILHGLTLNARHLTAVSRAKVADAIINSLRPIAEDGAGFLPKLGVFVDVFRNFGAATHKPLPGAAAFQIAPGDRPRSQDPLLFGTVCWKEALHDSTWTMAIQAHRTLTADLPAGPVPVRPALPWLTVTLTAAFLRDYDPERAHLLESLPRLLAWTLIETPLAE